VNEERTTVDPLPPLGEDSGKNAMSAQDLDDDHDPDFDIATRAVRPPTPADVSGPPTSPRGIKAHSGPLPTIYYAIAVAGVALIVLIAWLIAR
jgi:hypothetical protein